VNTALLHILLNLSHHFIDVPIASVLIGPTKSSHRESVVDQEVILLKKPYKIPSMAVSKPFS